jgi:hypothetical protein
VEKMYDKSCSCNKEEGTKMEGHHCPMKKYMCPMMKCMCPMMGMMNPMMMNSMGPMMPGPGMMNPMMQGNMPNSMMGQSPQGMYDIKMKAVEMTDIED